MTKYPKIIQGGMGVAISTWELAHAVSTAGQLGVVSGTGIGIVLIARLMDGDPGGHVRRALSHFPLQEVADDLIRQYYVADAVPGAKPYRRPAMWTINPPASLELLTVAANFVEVWLAKEGHNHPVGINLLEKVQMPNMASLYGAMLAGVDYVIMGAGIPMQIPGILDSLTTHQPVKYRLDVINAGDEEFFIHFNPLERFPGIDAVTGTLKRPAFLPVVSSTVLAQALLKRASGRIDGFVIEMPTAGGHNAPPRGRAPLNERGEPVYGDKDKVDLQKFRDLEMPFWLAGGYGSPEGLEAALAEGAQGIQVGTAFAFCDESGFREDLKQGILQQVTNGEVDVYTDPVASPTGFPFKVARLEGTASEEDVYKKRPRLCDIGYLRQLYKDDTGKVGYRCPAEPIKAFLKKGGKLEDTEGRKCLCNQLGSAAGFANQRRNGYVEPGLVTSGDDLVNVNQFMRDGSTTYSANDVIAHLLERQPVALS